MKEDDTVYINILDKRYEMSIKAFDSVDQLIDVIEHKVKVAIEELGGKLA